MRVMYKSPIDVFINDLAKSAAQKMDDEIYRAVGRVGIVVDKGELLKALQYDRNQYEAGFKDASNNIVRCKDCKDFSSVMFCGKPTHYGYCCNTHDSVLGNRHRFENDFCSYGERKDGADNDRK